LNEYHLVLVFPDHPSSDNYYLRIEVERQLITSIVSISYIFALKIYTLVNTQEYNLDPSMATDNVTQETM